MSAANRNGNEAHRAAFDFYPTDPRYVTAVLARIDRDVKAGRCAPLPRGVWCDPCAGDLSIVRAADAYHASIGADPVEWITVDIQPGPADICADFLRSDVATGADLYLTNPPYGAESGDAFDFVSTCVDRVAPGGGLLFLIRFGFFTARGRVAWNEAHPADIYPMAPRPSFGLNSKGKKGTDATDYVWARWGAGVTGKHHAPIDWRGPKEKKAPKAKRARRPVA